MKITREARRAYAQQIVDEINKEVEDPSNFTKNKYAEEAAEQVKIKGGDEDGSTEPSV